MTKAKVEELYFMIDAGLLWREIQEFFNITAPTINHWLKKRPKQFCSLCLTPKPEPKP